MRFFEGVDSETAATRTAAAGPPVAETVRASVRSTVVFVIALALLLTMAQSRTPRVLILVVLAVYIAAATLWARSQYAESYDDVATVPTRQLLGVIAVLGALAFGAGAILSLTGSGPIGFVRPGGLLVVGVILGYLGVGFGILRSRSRIGRSWAGPAPAVVAMRRLLLVLLAMAVVVVLGLVLLGRTPPALAAAVIGLGLLGMPFTISLLSEYAIRMFADPWAQRRTGGLALGAVLLVAGLGIAWGLGRTVLPAVVLVLLALLILAITSATLTDIAVVLAAVALMGITPAQDRPLPQPAPSAKRVLVALGDSYMSGEGASTFIAGTDEGGGNQCRRASTAWAVLAGQRPLFDGLIFLACSGALTSNVRMPGGDSLQPAPTPQGGTTETQLADYVEHYQKSFPDPALVVLSIGGNDAGFATVGLTCLAPGSCSDHDPSQLWSSNNLNRVENRLRQTYAQVRAVFPASPIAVIPYPNPIGPRAPCAQADLSRGDVAFIRKFLHLLDGRLQKAADDYGFYYAAPMINALADQHLQLCDPANNGRPGLNFIGLRSVNGLAEQRLNPANWEHNSLHPNERGHAALNTAFQNWLADQTRTVGGSIVLEGLSALQPPSARRPVPGGAAPVSETYTRHRGDCASYPVDDTQGCQALSTAWALRSTGNYLLARLGIVVMVLVGAWLISVTFFGSRRQAGRPARG